VRTCSNASVELVGWPTKLSSGAGKDVKGAPRFANFCTGRSKHLACSFGVAVKSQRPATGRNRLQIPSPAITFEMTSTRVRACVNVFIVRLLKGYDEKRISISS